ncbi:MAG TPA: hypothetical protein PLJ47_07305, partial [Candidatus Hydrogenedentes bacterium]|nr:hypothetical protein [Candidatus Hydrogenedentota bacterium]
SYDYSRLDPTFDKFSKPAKRAFIENSIFSPKDLANWTLRDILKLHGIGPASVPMLQEILRVNGLTFRPKKSG